MNTLKLALDELKYVNHLRQEPAAIAVMPQNTQYITVVTAVRVADNVNLNMRWGWGNMWGTVRYPQLSGQKWIGYLLHDGSSLQLKTETETVFDIPASDISDIFISSDLFWITTKQGAYAFGQIQPLLRSAMAAYGTNDKRISSGYYATTGGWWDEFKKLQVLSPEEFKTRENKSRRQMTVAWTITIVILVLLMIWWR